MEIIPSINCEDRACVESRLRALERLRPHPVWAQFDVADGKFTSHTTWNDPASLRELLRGAWLEALRVEAHLMVANPLDTIDAWVAGGASRIVVHAEALRENDAHALVEKSRGVEIGIAINPDTPVEVILPYLDYFKFVQVLAVHPGSAGQAFTRAVLEKIKFLKERAPDAILEVDGGVNPATAAECKEAGADIIVSAAHIFESASPQNAYDVLRSV